ncbi:GDSL-type esterase/lipase family protein [Solidesulfovibrio sp.]|uniref:GDSL-type esterase/lipase family protein n=1 Tax=Solidesulfovibrio sp. TaxID=2910990 RepID=UPI000EEE57A8|nr:GDSL-type esterase/lipase family protein [Solidesulfovibrio sp.]MEA5088363.1 GDSL-type esterase/lipase family protein [Solidesulfovibrio sp.]HCR12771.1 lysophospholipase [Desulfovibrio sp.]HML60282.1 GDSL-type esterase/lipase family protein [Solidesulfovibrio sp.]
MNAALPVLLAMQIVFCGDSITKGWEIYNLFDQPRKVFINGVESCTSADILKRIEPIARQKPHKLFLMIGINEISAQKRIIDNYDKIIKKIQELSPYTLIFVQSILPTRTDTIDNADVIATNDRLKELVARQNHFVRYLDLYDSFLADDGKLGPNFTEDGIHLTKNGYSLWKKLIVSRM